MRSQLLSLSTTIPTRVRPTISQEVFQSTSTLCATGLREANRFIRILPLSGSYGFHEATTAYASLNSLPETFYQIRYQRFT